MKTVDYERLPDVVGNFQGVGIPGISAKLVERTETEALYYRWDNVWEVFRIKVAQEGKILGRTYPKREVYPGNEDFGRTAWCFSNENLARDRYNAIVKHQVYSDAQETDESDSND